MLTKQSLKAMSFVLGVVMLTYALPANAPATEASAHGAIGGTLLFALNGSPAPANDDFDNATIITGLPFNHMLDTTEVTTAADDPTGCSKTASVWYSFTPAENMWLTASTAGSDYFAFPSVYTGVRGALTPIDVNQCAVAVETFAFTAVAGTTYYLMISTVGGTGGNLVFALNGTPAPANDDFDKATVIAGLPFNDTLDTRGAAAAADDPALCGSAFPYASVWYSFTPAEDMWLAPSTAGSDYPAVVDVFTGVRGALTDVACGAGVRAVADTKYYFMISNFERERGGTFRVPRQPVLLRYAGAAVIVGHLIPRVLRISLKNLPSRGLRRLLLRDAPGEVRNEVCERVLHLGQLQFVPEIVRLAGA